MTRTATGIDVEMVSPTLSPRYVLAAPKRMPNTMPAITALRLNSVMDDSAGTKGSYSCPSGMTSYARGLKPRLFPDGSAITRLL